jgi:hypothetical protein
VSSRRRCPWDCCRDRWNSDYFFEDLSFDLSFELDCDFGGGRGLPLLLVRGWGEVLPRLRLRPRPFFSSPAKAVSSSRKVEMIGVTYGSFLMKSRRVRSSASVFSWGGEGSCDSSECWEGAIILFSSYKSALHRRKTDNLGTPIFPHPMWSIAIRKKSDNENIIDSHFFCAQDRIRRCPK